MNWNSNPTSNYRITKQQIQLNVTGDNQQVSGSTDIEFQLVSSYAPRAILLNARQMTISSVSIGGERVKFEYIDSHDALVFSSGHMIRDASHFSRVSEIVCNSPDLIIPVMQSFPLTVHIEFSINQNSLTLIRKHGILYTDNRTDGPSGWFPCLDSLSQRTMFTLEITHPQKFVCIGPGSSKHVSTDSTNSTYKVLFTVPYPVQPCYMGFALGPFTSVQLEGDHDITLYYTEEAEALRHTLKPIQEIVSKVVGILGDITFEALSIAFIPSLSEILHFPSVILFPPSLLCPHANAVVYFSIVPRLFEAIFSQFFLFLFPVSSPSDVWIQRGLILFLADMASAQVFSDSFRFERRWNDLNFLMKEDIHESVVLSAIDPATGDPFSDEYLKVKAKLLINMISTSMPNLDPIRLLNDIVGPILNSCKETSDFASNKFYEKIPQQFPQLKLPIFIKQWVESNGFPIFTFNFTTDNRHNSMKLVLYQTPSVQTKIQFFTGQIYIQLHDMEQPYDQKCSVERQLLQLQLNYYARKKKTKQKEYEFQNGTKEKIDIFHQVLWVILDPSQSWVAKIRPRLPLFMIINQLKLLRHVFVQHQAISCLSDFADSEKTIKKLEDILADKNFYFGVRGHAARALATFASEKSDFKHMNVLMKWYSDSFLDAAGDPKPNDFSDVPRHLVQLEVIKSLSIIRNSQNFTPKNIVELLIKILNKQNNNENIYSDVYFVSECETALGRIRPEDNMSFESAEGEIRNSMAASETMPNYQNMVIACGYEALTAIALKNQEFVPDIKKMREDLLRNTQFFECRERIFMCLLFLCAVRSAVDFSELVSDVKRLCQYGNREMAARCLRQIYRFIGNSVRIGSDDKFEAYLLAIPADIDKAALIGKLINCSSKIDVAETLWGIMTVDAKYHKYLRSESLRAWMTLYGTGLPDVYKEYMAKASVYDLIADKSIGQIIRIEAPKNTQRGSLNPNLMPKPKKMKFKGPENSPPPPVQL